MIVKKMKQLIKYAIELNIDYLETFLGYEGDNVLKIITTDKKTLDAMEDFVKNVGLEYKIDFDISAGPRGGHVLYVGVEDPNLFKLKKD